ncbi:MAG: ComEA family DNA-binding protein [bacterium]|nr:ComEA family DNA-binding protein [bacterium]
MDKKKLFLIMGGVILLTIFVAFYYVFNKDNEVLDGFDNDVVTSEITSFKAEEKIFVDVKGAVKKPGVYEMSSSDRVVDAIKMAGGLKSNASTNNINLSKTVSNEMVIYVFTKSEITTKVASSVPCECETITVNNCVNNGEDADNSTSDKVNVNKASKEELMKLNGLGESKAEAIITYRNNNGVFKTIEDIKNVSGIGDALFDKIKDFITV